MPCGESTLILRLKLCYGEIMKPLLAAVLFLAPIYSFAAEEPGVPSCKAVVYDGVNYPIERLEWEQKIFTGSIQTPSRTVLITTSLGNKQVMSLWVREKKEGHPSGMNVFLKLSPERDQDMRFYMVDGYSVGVKCRWQAGTR